MSNQRASSQQAIVLVAGIAVGVAVTTLVQALTSPPTTTARRRADEDDHQQQQPPSSSTTTSASSFPLELRQEQLSRHTLFFGQDGMRRLQDAKICVVGAGGVGSHTVAALCRAGVGYIRVIDFDQVSLSSLNRHACAGLAQVGTPKVTALQEYARQQCPAAEWLTVDARVEMYTAETGERLLELENDKWDMIIDAIDDVPTKAQLIYDAWQRRVRCISCMGAGGKADFTRLHMSDLKSASRDPLATKLRQCIKKLIPTKQEADEFMEDSDRLAVVFSSEKTVQKLADFTEEQKESDTALGDFGQVKGMRVRILPVLGTMPAIMGQALAAACLTELAEQPFQPVTGERVGKNVRNKLFQKLTNREDKYTRKILQDYNITNEDDVARYKTTGGAMELVDEEAEEQDHTNKHYVWIGPLQIDSDDVEYLMEIWKNRCAITGTRLGTVLELVRWDESRPATCDNLILVAQHAKNAWDENGRNSRHLSLELCEKIEKRLATCRIDSMA